MASITIRNLDNDVKTRLRVRASGFSSRLPDRGDCPVTRHGRSDAQRSRLREYGDRGDGPARIDSSLQDGGERLGQPGNRGRPNLTC